MQIKNYYQHVSCVLCRRQFTRIASLSQHSCYTKQNRSLNKASISNASRKSVFLKGIIKWKNYYSNPSNCKFCGSCLDWFQRHNKFCSHSCSASDNNLYRQPRSLQSRSKTSSALIKFNKLKHPPNTRAKYTKTDFVGPYTRIYLCTCKFSGKQWYSTTVKTIHPSVQTTKNQYAYQCRFNFSISQHPEWFVGASELIKQYGWYSTPGSRKGIKNTNGISRDHMYSVSDGFRNQVDPKILSHPANCCLIRHTDNQKKRSKSSITLEELFARIKQFDSMFGTG